MTDTKTSDTKTSDTKTSNTKKDEHRGLGGLEVRVDGETVKTFDEQVLTLRVNTSAGESSITHIGPNQKVVDITFDKVDPYGIPRLDQLEAEEMQATRERAEKSTSIRTEPDVLTDDQKKARKESEDASKADQDTNAQDKLEQDGVKTDDAPTKAGAPTGGIAGGVNLGGKK